MQDPGLVPDHRAVAAALQAAHEFVVGAGELRLDARQSAAVQQGDVVTFAVGRKDDRRELTGNVLGVQDDEAKGKLLRVFAGEGFDAQVYTVAAKDIVGVRGEELAESVEETAE